MRLEVRGHPLHTRALAVTLLRRDDGRLDLRGTLLDLRKRGVIPVASELQGPGIIHHMLLDAVLDPSTCRLDEIVTRQPSVAFEPSAVTRGESCRDPAARVEALEGSMLDDDYARRLSAAIGGPRGCSHILTLAQILGSTGRWALERGLATQGRPGERLFRRDIVLDGHESGEGRVDMAIQLTDMHFAPSQPVAHPMARFGSQYEARALARIDASRLTLDRVDIGERRRSASQLDEAVWQDRADIGASLAGQSVLRGSSAALLERLAAAPDDAPIYDALLMLAPTMIQCFAAMSDGWLRNARETNSLIGMGGMADSCFMWRRDGALHQLRTAEDPVPSLAK